MALIVILFQVCFHKRLFVFRNISFYLSELLPIFIFYRLSNPILLCARRSALDVAVLRVGAGPRVAVRPLREPLSGVMAGRHAARGRGGAVSRSHAPRAPDVAAPVERLGMAGRRARRGVALVRRDHAAAGATRASRLA